MAVYTTFFVCEPQELVAVFPGWRLPLPTPVRREFKNPFTGKTTVVETREPNWPDDEDAEEIDRERLVVAAKGNYEDYLESRLSSFIRAQPHWCSKNVTQVELKPLGQTAGVEMLLECPLYGPPSLGAMLQQVSPSLCERLLAFDGAGLAAVARAWAMAMSAPEYTHSVTGIKLSDGWTTSEAMSLLKPIADLARQAVGEKGMYVLTEGS
jgi:hypothetical protein